MTTITSEYHYLCNLYDPPKVKMTKDRFRKGASLSILNGGTSLKNFEKKSAEYLSKFDSNLRDDITFDLWIDDRGFVRALILCYSFNDKNEVSFVYSLKVVGGESKLAKFNKLDLI